MRLQLDHSLLSVLVHSVTSQKPFIYPAPYTASSQFSTNEVWIEGDYKFIQWTANTTSNHSMRIEMYQTLGGGQAIGDTEYIRQDLWSADDTSVTWQFQTSRNLTLSLMFYMNLYRDDQANPWMSTTYLNITSGTAGSTTTTSSISSTSSCSFITSQTSTSTPTQTPSASPSPTPVAVTSSGMSTGAKVGIAVRVVGAALLDVLAAWLIFGRKRKSTQPDIMQSEHLPMQTNFHDQSKMANISEMENHPVQSNYYDGGKAAQSPPYTVSNQPSPQMGYELPSNPITPR